MIDKNKLNDKLLLGFIYHEYTTLYGVRRPDFKEEACHQFNNDPTFRYRVKRIVSDIMQMVQECEASGE